MRLLLVCLFSLLLGLPLRAEDLLQTAQRELRARKFYFGEIDGRATDETVAAIKKFQEARGIDDSGHLDDQTLRALGLPAAERANREEGRLLDECCTCILRYWQARQSGDWDRVSPVYAGTVNYLYDGPVDRAELECIHAGENENWPLRKHTMLNRIAALMPGNRAQVTARIYTEAHNPTGFMKRRTEDYIFRLQKKSDDWCITEMKLLKLLE